MENGSGNNANVAAEAASSTMITVTIDPELLECCFCYSPLVPPLFQCTSGHITCSECSEDLDYECSMCVETDTTTRCRAMELVVSSLAVPCKFQEYGCTKMTSYAEKLAHEVSCPYAPCYCPVAGCGPYPGRSLREHINQEHPAPQIMYTCIPVARLSPVMMRDGEAARLLHLNGRGMFLLVVDQNVPSGRALSVVHLMTEPFEEEDFKYKIQVYTRTGILFLSGDTQIIGRLTSPYQARASLFVPDAMWSPEDSPIYIELK